MSEVNPDLLHYGDSPEAVRENLIIQRESTFAQLNAIYDTVKNLSQDDFLRCELLFKKIPTYNEDHKRIQNDIAKFNSTQEKRKRIELVAAQLAYDQLTFSIELHYHKLKALMPDRVTDTTSADQVRHVSHDNTLARITLPQFNGDIDAWLEFISIFDSLVHTKAMDNIVKFRYLKTSLKGDAAAIISGFALTSDNYPLAYEALRFRYNNKRRIASFYLQKILEYKTTHLSNLNNLNSFLSTHETAIKSIRAMKMVDLSDFILFHLTLNNLDANMRREFELRHSDKEIPSYTDLITFVTNQLRSLELQSPTIRSSGTTFSKTSKPKSFLVNTSHNSNKSSSLKHNTQISKCIRCRGEHNFANCPSYLKMELSDKYRYVRSINRCFNCLGSHSRAQCSSKNVCRKCNSNQHHTSLHSPAVSQSSVSPPTDLSVSNKSNTSPSTSSSQSPCSTGNDIPALSCTSYAQNPQAVLLGTAQILIHSPSGNYFSVRALVDPGSQVSIISLACCRALGLPIKPTSTQISGIGATETTCYGTVACVLKSKYSDIRVSTTAYVMSTISMNLPSLELSHEVINRFASLKLADSQFYRSSPVDFLIGADLFPSILSCTDSQPIQGFPSAINSIFGWLIIGPVEGNPPTQPISLLSTASISTQLQHFWETEEVSVSIPSNPLDILAETHFKNTHTRDSTGRYIVALPFRPGSFPALSNKERSLASFVNLEKRLVKCPEKYKAYTQFMNEYISLNHMSEATKSSSYVIPHHCVIKDTSTSTKLRVVFNASDSGYNKTSLNSLLLPGPKLQSDISDILYSFRFNAIALCSDIRQMYRQILVRPEDRSFQHIFYRPTPQSDVVEYELNTVTYGLVPSAFLAQRCLKQLVLDEGEPFPMASQALLHNTYVDDIITGASSIEQAKKLLLQLQKLMSRGGFELRKWTSNDPSLLVDLPVDHIETPFLFETETVFKILGLLWDPTSDSFLFQVKPFERVLTKRTLLSHVAGVYDPLGFLAPITFSLKCILQNLWLDHSGWDDPVPASILKIWDTHQQTMHLISQIRIPRHIVPSGHTSLWLAGFSDASQLGYSAVLYLCCDMGNSIVSHLFAAKTKVAPLKTLTIPRLELCGALLLSKLLSSVRKTMPHLFQISPRLFTDAHIVLYWLNTPPHLLKVYVANRVVAIQQLTQQACWSHVPTAVNPADISSRGLTPDQFTEPTQHDLWFQGPTFISEPLSQWPPPFSSVLPDLHDLPEVKPLALVAKINSPEPLLEFFSRFSSWTRLQRVVAWIFRFIKQCKARIQRTTLLSGPLSVTELDSAKIGIVYATQRYYFSSEINTLSAHQALKGSFSALNPFLDSFSLLRVGGRLDHSQLSSGAKHPLLLPKAAYISKLICIHAHLCSLHSGPRAVQASIQATYWIPGLRGLVRKTIRNCSTCYRFRAVPFAPQMASLPGPRVTPSRPFSHTGVDFAGPFVVRSGNPRKPRLTKGYLCIFVCFSTKCVHLEFASELSTQCFLATLDRFVSRRGLPSDIYSDQGRNFLGASRLLKEISIFLQENRENISDYLTLKGIQWHFNCAYSPWFGGLWEAGVKSAKTLLKRMFHESSYSVEDYFTIFTRIEAVLNSRPLCDLPNDPSEASSYLTPGHFLIGTSLTSLPEKYSPSEQSVRDRWLKQRQLVQSFWKRWSAEYLNTLLQRNKWKVPAATPEVGDVVLIKGDHSPPLSWPIGRVIKLHMSPDGVPRVADLRLANQQTITRAVARLLPLRESFD